MHRPQIRDLRRTATDRRGAAPGGAHCWAASNLLPRAGLDAVASGGWPGSLPALPCSHTHTPARSRPRRAAWRAPTSRRRASCSTWAATSSSATGTTLTSSSTPRWARGPRPGTRWSACRTCGSRTAGWPTPSRTTSPRWTRTTRRACLGGGSCALVTWCAAAVRGRRRGGQVVVPAPASPAHRPPPPPPSPPQIKCLTGLVEAKVKNSSSSTKPANFDDWILRVMGSGIADLFMRPYNFKVRPGHAAAALRSAPALPCAAAPSPPAWGCLLRGGAPAGGGAARPRPTRRPRPARRAGVGCAHHQDAVQLAGRARGHGGR
jgi:hypothetical protein